MNKLTIVGGIIGVLWFMFFKIRDLWLTKQVKTDTLKEQQVDTQITTQDQVIKTSKERFNDAMAEYLKAKSMSNPDGTLKK